MFNGTLTELFENNFPCGDSEPLSYFPAFSSTPTRKKEKKKWWFNSSFVRVVDDLDSHMSQGFGASELPHVAQQSRRDKLRVQNHGLAAENPNPNTHDLIYNTMLSSPGILDFTNEAAASSSFVSNTSNSSDWMNANNQSPMVQSHLYRLPIEMAAQDTLQAMVHGGTSTTQGPLSLSLSSKPRFDVGISCPVNPTKISVDPWRNVGPIGPFTGYATILKSSRFLRPAQQLLDEFCSAVIGSNRYSGRCDDGMNCSRLSSSSIYSSSEGGNHTGEAGASSGGRANCSIPRPENQQKKVKLLYMQEEVCRRYKQYHQQMQMVVSSFESVAGLNAATPYASLALKAISRQFRSIKHTISNQLRYVSRVLGEDFMPSSPGTSSRGGETTTPQLNYIDQSLRKQKASENPSLSFLDNNQPVWRPQRGLPERAVTVLRAWLFDHFLHPYPTDTEKHMLANQTGLTRNQVSNWFINARVRLWKPMVEEIHSLESKGVPDMDLNSSNNRNDGKSVLVDQGLEARSNRPLDRTPYVDPAIANEHNSFTSMEQWQRDQKRSRMEGCSIDGGLMSYAYPTDHIGALGAVSLTLGLRHNEDPQQQQQMRHFGGHMLHDFEG